MVTVAEGFLMIINIERLTLEDDAELGEEVEGLKEEEEFDGVVDVLLFWVGGEVLMRMREMLMMRAVEETKMIPLLSQIIQL